MSTNGTEPFIRALTNTILELGEQEAQAFWINFNDHFERAIEQESPEGSQSTPAHVLMAKTRRSIVSSAHLRRVVGEAIEEHGGDSDYDEE